MSPSDGLLLPRSDYKKMLVSISLPSLTSSLALREASCSALGLPVEKPVWPGTEGGLHFSAMARKEMNPANTCRSQLGTRSSPVEPSDETAAAAAPLTTASERDLEAEVLLTPETMK